jgi:hypothetical protein
MPRPKSTIKNLEITVAKASHNCKNNTSHRIAMGEQRLSIKEGRSTKNYCSKCALEFLKSDIQKLNILITKLEKNQKANSALPGFISIS